MRVVDRSYAASLRGAVIVLAALAVLQGGAALVALAAVDRGVERGRLAGAILSDLQRFDLQKERLRALTVRAAVDGADDPARRAALLDDMAGLAEAIAANGALAARLDAGADETDSAKRGETVAALRRLVQELREEIAPPVGASTRPDERPSALDRPGGADLRALMDERMAVEERVQGRQRARADAALEQARLILAGAGGVAVLAAALMAAALPRRLLRPLRALEDAVRAFAEGRLDHRIAPPREIEFARIADQLQTMAGEIAARREQERGFRIALETAIEARTAALRDALEDVEASETARRALLADIGHELRTPLTVIRGEAQVALRDRDADAAAYRDSLGKIAAAAAQTGRLIDDLFAMSAARAAVLSMTVAPVDLRDIVRDAVQAMAGAVAPGGVVRVELPDDPVMAVADAGRIRQVVAILLDNGLRYGAPAQGVCVVARPVEGGAEVTVSDRGPGLEPAEAARAFERGWRGAAAQRRRPDGHGLGLSIAAGIADRHGGRLTLENRPGGGARARLFLPAAS